MNWRPSSSTAQPLRAALKRHARPICVAAATVAAGAAAAAACRKQEPFRLQLSSTVVEAVSGAVGEVAQIALLYPLDTLKVRCQAAACSSRAALAAIAAAHKPLAALGLLYAGAVPAALTSVVVGSVHYMCFCATRRAVLRLADGPWRAAASSGGSGDGPRPDAAAAGAAGSTAVLVGRAGDPDAGAAPLRHHHPPHLMLSHGPTGSHFHLLLEEQGAGGGAVPAVQGAGASAGQQPAQPGPSGADADAAAADAAAAPDPRRAPDARLAANVAAALLTAAVTALVEAPLELYRHNAQAGQLQGNFVAEMVRAGRRHGPGALYLGFVPYLLEAFPYDSTELMVVGSLRDARGALCGTPGPLGAAVAAAPPHAFDLAVGALAGAAAVLVSMPFDTVKTVLQTRAPRGARQQQRHGLLGGAAAFWSTGRALVARGGPGALWVGLLPRLAHQVPGAMVCWWAIEGCHRHLQRHQRHGSHAAAGAAAAADARCCS